MGVAGLWDILRPAGETRSLTHLAVVDGFEANPDGVRGFRVGIDASIWFYHATYGREGENPELRTLFFKCTKLMSAPFLPLFVFDGPKRPEVKRGKRISGKNHWMIQGMQEIINAFGFEWRMAPGEAEAELAYLNRIGVIDAVYTDDVDTFLFGAKMIVRNPSATLSGNRAHSLKNSAGREDGNHVATYTSHAILTHPSIQLTQGGLILIGILRGGDYHQAGLTGCGGTIAHGLARCGFGDNLLTAARTLPRADLPAFLRSWREEIRAELRTNSRGILGKKYAALAKKIPEDFPDIEVLLSYTSPVTSQSEAAAKGRTSKNTQIDWGKEPDLGKIAGLCEMYFEWGVKEIIIKRFRTVLWPAAVLRILRRVALLEDKRTASTAIVDPKTPTKRGKDRERRAPGTPSSVITKHFSSLQLDSLRRAGCASSNCEDDDGEDKLIVKIHSSRQHASTDGILEYRLEVAPAHLVRLSESGVRGLRTALATGLDDDSDVEDEDSDGGGKGKKRVQKPPPNPQSHLRIWLPACMVRIAQPDLVEEFEGIQEMRAAKKVGKASGAARGSKINVSTAAVPKTKAAKKTPVAVQEEEDESSDGYVSPTPKKARPKPKPTKRGEAIAASAPKQASTVKDFFAVGKSTQTGSNSGKLKANTAKIAALFADEPAGVRHAACIIISATFSNDVVADVLIRTEPVGSLNFLKIILAPRLRASPVPSVFRR
ncbi:PIN domain-like protein [Daedalea quercina L-15889]|uniref:PIN domain-like protein n=1 Tax=Daedalea quercina L-15889 TaxID=1314783 RepID=A0A165LU39_9APHY|nr:PIN domain-like protein [Daedalea quercina L-15889]